MQRPYFHPHMGSELGVKVGEGLVQQEQPGVAHHGPGRGHALTLAARELGRFSLEVVFQLDDAGDPADALRYLGLSETLNLQRER